MLSTKPLNFIYEKRIPLIAILGLLLFLFFSLVFIQFTVDDSFINFRYAKNFVHHGIWNWNSDHDYVEANTGFIYPVLALIPEFSGFPTTVFFKFFSIGLVVLLLLRIRASFSKETFIVFFLLLVLNWMFYVHMYSGLETVLFIFLMVEANIILIKVSNKDQYNESYLWFLCFLLPLTRIEGLLWSFIIFGVFIYFKGKVKQKIIFSAFIFLLITYFVWRYFYFGFLLPNPAYLKGFYHGGIDNFFGNVYKSSSYIVVVILLMAIIRTRSFTMIAIVSILFFISVYSYSSLMMNYADRFFFQIFYPVILTSVLFLNPHNKGKLILIFTFILLLAYHNNLGEIKRLIEYYPNTVNSYKKTADIFSRYASKDTKLLLLDAGVIPYYTDIKCYDAVGLANKHVAHYGLDLEYIESVNPDLIILNSESPSEADVMRIYGQNVMLDYAKKSNYHLLPAVRFNDSSYLLIYVQSEYPYKKQMETAFNELQSRHLNFGIKDLFSLKYL